eukprot:13783766-Alexandrium_andersonii.AAC.1
MGRIADGRMTDGRDCGLPFTSRLPEGAEPPPRTPPEERLRHARRPASSSPWDSGGHRGAMTTPRKRPRRAG